MKNIFVSPPFDLTHTLIYAAIDNKMALKLAGSKAFPDLSHLIKLAGGVSKSMLVNSVNREIENK